MSVPAPIVKVRPRVAPTELQFWWSPPVKWLVAGGATNSILISTDGTTWTPSANNPFPPGTSSSDVANGVAWNGSYWATIAANGRIATSADADTWTTATTNPFVGSGGQGNGLAWNGTYWVAVGRSPDGTVSIITSTDGDTWMAASTNPLNRAHGVAWNGTYWIAVGLNEGTSTVSIVKSTDGDTWTAASTFPFGSFGYGVAWNGSYWIAVGNGAGNTECIAKSTNGETWTASSNNPFYGSSGAGYGIAWNGSYWLAVGTDGVSVSIAKSTDGMTWTLATDNPFSGGSGYGISWNGSYWVAVGTNNTRTVCIATSINGMTWTNVANNNLFTSFGAFGVANNLSTINSITNYILESVSPAVTQTVGPSLTTTTVSGLTNLTDYSFTIKTNIGGSYSSTVPFRTVRTSVKPEPVTTLTQSQSIVNGELNVTFSWTNPGDYATYYVYGLRTATGTRDTIYKGTSEYATLSYTFTGLDPVRAYKFNIQRGNDAGYSTKTSVTTTAVPFDPTTVTGLYFWADATDVSGNGATVADGSTVGTWKDKSGTSNNATATTGATVQTDSVGRYLNFTGSSWYSLAQSSWAYNQYFTFFVVDKPVNYTGSYTLISNQASSTDSLIITYNTADGIRLSTGGDNAALGNAFQGVTAPVNIWCFTNYGGKTAYWNKLVSGKATTEAFITDSLLSIGAVQGSTNLYNGRMREILMYSGIMSEANRGAVTTYLYNKWFTQPNLFPLTPVENSAVLWLDAQDITTFFQDLSGTVSVTTDGQAIRRWADKSGFGNDIYCTGGGAAEYDSTGINYLPVFNTNSAGGTIQTNNYLQTGDATLFLVADKSANLDFYFQHDILNNFGLTQYTTDAVSWHESATTNNNQFTDTGVPFIFYGKMQKAQLLSGTFIKSSAIQTSYTVDTLTMTVSTAPIKLTSDYSVYYGEVIYYNRALTDAEIQTNAAYLSNKWGIAIPTVTTFSPQQISGMKLWLDAADPYTLLESGGAVTLWKDRSGNGNNAVPSGSPTINNGVVFNGSSQWLSLPESSLPQDNYSYYIVSKLAGSSAIINAGSKDISGQMWLATGEAGQTAISFNGLTWLYSATVFSGGEARGIASNGSYWVVVGYNTDNTVCIAKSTDGLTWTVATNNPFSGGVGYGIAWNGTYWVAVGYNTGATVSIAKSTDGMTWTNATDNPFNGGYGNGIAWNGSYWVAVGQNSGNTVCIAKSTDGMTWTNATDNPFSGGYGRGVAWNGSYWVAVGNSVDFTVCIAKSTDGLIWTNATDNPFSGSSARGIAWNGSYWVAVGTNSGNTVCIAKSTDGLIWTVSTNNPFSGAYGSGIAWNGSYWTAVGGNGGASVFFATSIDGLIWTSSSNNPFSSSRATAIAWGIAPIHNSFTNIKAITVPATSTYVAKTTFDYTLNNQKTFVAVGGGGIARSPDGRIWTAATNNPFTGGGQGIGVAWNGTYFLALGSGTYRIAKSTNGMFWTPATDDPFSGSSGRGVAWNGSYWVAVGNATVCIAKSTNGDTWTNSTNNPFSGGGALGIAWNGSYWVAVGANSDSTVTMAKSTDGLTWTDASNNPFSGTGGSAYGIAWNGSYWVAVGNNGGQSVCIAKSTDGMTWTNATDNPFSLGFGKGIGWNGSYWIAVGNNDGSTVTIAKSTDGMIWTNATDNPFSGANGNGVAWNGSYWVAVGANSGNTVFTATSSNGLTWTNGTANPFGGGQGFAIVYTTLPFGEFSLTDTNIIPADTTVIIESLYYTGTTKSLFLSGKTGATDTSTHIQDAANNFIGKDLSGGYMNGTIKEILVYDTAHTTEQREQIELYLKNKWYPDTYTPTGTCLWLDSADASNFTLSGSSVQVWKDKSAQATNYSQSYAWAQPLYTLDPITLKYGVRFGADAITTGLTNATSPFGATNSWSVFAVQRYDYSSNQAKDVAAGHVCTAYKAVHSDTTAGWVAVGANTSGINTITVSTDGMSWGFADNPFSGGNGLGVAWNGTYWVAVGNNTGGIVTIAKSTDGITWATSTNNPFSGGSGEGIAWNGTYWVAVGANTGSTVNIAKSTDGMTWTPSTNNPFAGGSAREIAWNGTYWVAVGSNVGATVTIAKSTDGMTWTNATDNPFSDGQGFGIAWNGSYWIAVAGATVTIAKSTDGMTWTNSTNNPFSGGNGLGVAWNGSYWVAVGNNDDATVTIAKSTDGMTWTNATDNPFTGGAGNGIAWNGTYWVAVGANTGYTVSIAKSTDGLTWTNATDNPFTGGDGFGIAYGNIRPGSVISCGTGPVSTPSIIELNMIVGVTSTPATVEIHKRPVLTSQVVNSLVYNDFVNGVANATSVTSAQAMTTNIKLNIGYKEALSPALLGAMRGYIYELIVFKTTITTQTRQAVEGYLAWKWGIQDLLATTHPYYLAPPQ